MSKSLPVKGRRQTKNSVQSEIRGREREMREEIELQERSIVGEKNAVRATQAVGPDSESLVVTDLRPGEKNGKGDL